mmetsp:Transcript_45563/g.101897  ORF Transcript_45563/g.101897 Transcript_45563/m.101897 type:complete len:99 (-) Transcript_45563:21-317(-)
MSEFPHLVSKGQHHLETVEMLGATGSVQQRTSFPLLTSRVPVATARRHAFVFLQQHGQAIRRQCLEAIVEGIEVTTSFQLHSWKSSTASMQADQMSRQ